MLGAFGCIAFRSNPAVAARTYRDIFPEFDRVFPQGLPATAPHKFDMLLNKLCEARSKGSLYSKIQTGEKAKKKH